MAGFSLLEAVEFASKEYVWGRQRGLLFWLLLSQSCYAAVAVQEFTMWMKSVSNWLLWQKGATGQESAVASTADSMFVV